MFNYLALGVGSIAGGIVTFTAVSLFLIPGEREEARRIAEAQAMERTYEAIASVSDVAERARTMRRYCSSRGELYDFATGKCREYPDSTGR